MTDVALRVCDLGKRYRLGVDPLRNTLADRLSSLARWRRQPPFSNLSDEQALDLWALRQVSFELPRGQVLGVIGGNGAGKSTLLKILSRITPPTTGRVELFGNVASLLEVGTGFHPDLTGRENIFLNGALLGLRRRALAARLESIVSFAEIERFIDTPVKRYSSGMYLRLAFAVAAHLEPDILLVDEVLAVGDARFQQKCLGKLHELSGGGRTVIFVSHNMAAVQRLCTLALVLAQGRVSYEGTPAAAVRQYLQSAATGHYRTRTPSAGAHVVEAFLETPGGRRLERAAITEALTVAVRVKIPVQSAATRLGVGLLDAEGTPILTSNLDDDDLRLPAGPTELLARVTLPPNTLLAGDYHVVTCLWNESAIVDLQEPAFAFSADAGASPLYRRDSRRKGVLHAACRWQLETSAEVAEAWRSVG